MDPRDAAFFEEVLKNQGRWLVSVHGGHVVKISIVGPELSASEVRKKSLKTLARQALSMVQCFQSNSSP